MKTSRWLYMIVLLMSTILCVTACKDTPLSERPHHRLIKITSTETGYIVSAEGTTVNEVYERVAFLYDSTAQEPYVQFMAYDVWPYVYVTFKDATQKEQWLPTPGTGATTKL